MTLKVESIWGKVFQFILNLLNKKSNDDAVKTQIESPRVERALVSSDILKVMGASDKFIRAYITNLNKTMRAYNINTPLRIAHFLAQLMHESGSLRHTVENMNYSADALLKVFPKYFKTHQDAEKYARKPEAIGNRVYANRMDNGSEASGDGYRYRGRGLIQLTGRRNYRLFSKWYGVDVVGSPDDVANRYAVESAVFYWDTNQLNDLADTDDIRAVTKAINGGLNGLTERIDLLKIAKSHIVGIR